MFRCNKCGARFKKLTITTLKHNLDTPPFEERGVCPECHSDEIIPLITDSIKRTEVIEQVLSAALQLNLFAKKVNGIISEKALGTFDTAYDRLYELLDYAAVGSVGPSGPDYKLPTDFDEKISNMETEEQKDELYKLLLENIAEG